MSSSPHFFQHSEKTSDYFLLIFFSPEDTVPQTPRTATVRRPFSIIARDLRNCSQECFWKENLFIILRIVRRFFPNFVLVASALPINYQSCNTCYLFTCSIVMLQRPKIKSKKSKINSRIDGHGRLHHRLLRDGGNVDAVRAANWFI